MNLLAAIACGLRGLLAHAFEFTHRTVLVRVRTAAGKIAPVKWLLQFAALAVILFGSACNGKSDPTSSATPTTKTTGGDTPTTGKTAGTNPIIAPPPLADLKIEDVRVGKGPAANKGDLVVVLYTGKLGDGTQFDSNDKADGRPIGFPLGQAGTVIEGWSRGLVGMKAGGVRKLSIPARLAYGPNGSGQIPANADLYFEVKMLGIVKKGDEGTYDKPIDVKSGTGPPIKIGDNVTVDYEVWYLNDVSVYSTKREGKPETFSVGVLDPQSHSEKAAGFTSAIIGMKQGGIRTFTLPPAIAYRATQLIAPNNILKFRVELLRVNKRGTAGAK